MVKISVCHNSDLPKLDVTELGFNTLVQLQQMSTRCLSLSTVQKSLQENTRGVKSPQILYLTVQPPSENFIQLKVSQIIFM